MQDKMKLKRIAQEVLELLDRGHYEVEAQTIRIAGWQNAARLGTRLYTPSQCEQLRSTPRDGETPSIQVLDATTQVAAQQMAVEGTKTALLNFASARNPGGGFVNGAKAQEEDLCRCSGLYPCLLECMQYFDANRSCDSLIYTDHMIYSPEVPFFKTRGTGDLLAEPFTMSVLTAPAPNSRPFLEREQGDEVDLERAFLRRWQNVCCAAADQGIESLLLGAWGCGAFGGDPEMAARTAEEAIRTHGRGLDSVVFAIPGKGKQSRRNLEVFGERFGSLA
ncbi:MAG: TIGR02452 family protein [Planctomycetota bacterium]